MVDSFTAVAFPRCNFQFYCLSALKQWQIPTGKYDVYLRMLQMNSLGLLAQLILSRLFPFFHLSETTLLQLGVCCRQEKCAPNMVGRKCTILY